MPKVYSGARRSDDRRVISGIIHVLKSGCRWQDCPSVYDPPTTIYNRFHRWSGRRLWHRMLEALIKAYPDEELMIDSTPPGLIVQPLAEKGGTQPGHRPLMRWLND